jgi:hypothetical protein
LETHKVELGISNTCEPEVEIDSFIFGDDVDYEESKCVEITLEDGECFENIDSVILSSVSGLIGLNYTTSQGNTGYITRNNITVDFRGNSLTEAK